MSKSRHVEWDSITIGLDQLDSNNLGKTATFTINADGSWSSLEEFRFENGGAAGLSNGTLQRSELRFLDKLLDIVNHEPVPHQTRQVSHEVPDDTRTLVLNNPGDSVTLFENRDERAARPGAFAAFDDRADLVEIAAVALLVNHLGEKYAGEDFLLL